MKKSPVTLFIATALLAGCAGFTGQYYVDDLNAADISGAGFTNALAREYRDLANYEWAEMLDYRDGQHYAKKGLAAAGGEAVAPDMPESRDLPVDAVSDITAAHTQLTEVLSVGAADRVPDLAAKAQASFDCWMEQQEENHQPDHIAACRKKFEDAMQQIGPAKYQVFFNTGSSHLSRAAMTIIRQAAKDAKERHVTGFTIVGHTDTKGSAAANKTLSMARARAVKAALVAQGFRARNITISGDGETVLLVSTPDNTSEPSNRRAELRFK